MKTVFWVLLLLALPARAAVPTPHEVKAAWRSSDTTLLDRHGETIATVRVDMTGRRLAWVALDDISPALGRAVLQAEDQRFMEHGGIDFQAIGKAAWDNLFSSGQQRTRGASTITMQLAGLLDPKLAPRSSGRTWMRKWDQALAARELEAGWTKRQILEAYLNLASYRGELQGIGAAARGLFGKAPSGLDAGEAAILASLLRAPTAPPRTVAKRACTLARELDARTDCAAIEWEVDAAFARTASAPASAPTGVTPQLVRRLGGTPGSVVRSTLDAGLQRFTVAALRRHLAELAERNVGDGAVIVIANASGAVLAYVANGGTGEVDGVTALRQAGSTLKPFLYELALERGQLTAASLLDDTPVDIPTVGGLYVPQNYDHQYRDAASVRTSLAGSLNVPAVRTLMLAGLERFHERLRALGITSLTEAPEFYGWSLALGSGDVSLLELAHAYRTLANGGVQDGKRRVLDARASFIVADILSDRAARSTTFGLSNELATGFWSAVKTGTSKDMRDNWCVGFSDRYTVGVWVGNFDGRSMWEVSGVSGAAPVWRDVMDYLHRDRPSRPPAAPPGVVRQTVRFAPAVEPERSEWFVRGTEVALVEMLPPAKRAPRIVYPAADSVIALDPDIPAPLQRVSFRAYGGAGLRWQLDGADAGPADRGAAWTPQPGEHELKLVGESGRAVAAARFEVRGQLASTFSTSTGGSAGRSSGNGVNSGESER
ncbi:penicillin-binding protein 1C [Telluria mixta]|uniref:peptidoglycan glycosyltransferase n=1 Tax=Telluria mixta TaxID=34071 RepID=A0ABT2C6L6_9BURK|nr:penicillin-binding protein 1C [Telluria mixta]MCS0633053.1 penicillin-binding protein 1C [Telluria mixta]WEM96130.1 penicillin-binding protein 1C [Telluria mixta]